MNRFVNVSLALSFLILSSCAVLRASEEDFLPWRSVTIDCGTYPDVGKVTVDAKTDGSGISSFVVSAFGRSFSLPSSEISKIRLFPLEGLKVTRVGAPRVGWGNSICIRLRSEKEALVVINEKKGVEVRILEKK